MILNHSNVIFVQVSPLGWIRDTSSKLSVSNPVSILPVNMKKLYTFEQDLTKVSIVPISAKQISSARSQWTLQVIDAPFCYISQS